MFSDISVGISIGDTCTVGILIEVDFNGWGLRTGILEVARVERPRPRYLDNVSTLNKQLFSSKLRRLVHTSDTITWLPLLNFLRIPIPGTDTRHLRDYRNIARNCRGTIQDCWLTIRDSLILYIAPPGRSQRIARLNGPYFFQSLGSLIETVE